MNIYYTNNLKSAYQVVEGEEQEEEDYQVAMLRENKISGLLPMHVRYVNNRSQYYYDISGMQSLKAKYEKEKLKHADMHKLIKELLAAMEAAKTYMLDGGKFYWIPITYIVRKTDTILPITLLVIWISKKSSIS